MEGRLLELTLGDPYSNVAFEEALLREARVSTLRVWMNQRSVVIGRAQLARFETDLDYCREHSIPVVRRMTPGGAVYNGPGNLNWTFFVPVEDGSAGDRGTLDTKGVFERFASVVVGALGACGVEARFEPPNSIFDGKGKVCGMAAFVTRTATICHGTLLADADIEEAMRVTMPRGEDIQRRYQRSRHVQVSNSGVLPGAFAKALSSTGAGYSPGTPTDDEEEALAALVPKYLSEEWNLGDPFA